MRRISFALTGSFVAGLLLFTAGCHKDAASSPAGVRRADGARRPQLPRRRLRRRTSTAPRTPTRWENAWRTAGLAPEGFAALQPVPYGASYCEEGRVQSIDTLVCEYRDQDSLAKGQAGLMEQWDAKGDTPAWPTIPS